MSYIPYCFTYWNIPIAVPLGKGKVFFYPELSRLKCEEISSQFQNKKTQGSDRSPISKKQKVNSNISLQHLEAIIGLLFIDWIYQWPIYIGHGSKHK